jgi:hypothetical protein
VTPRWLDFNGFHPELTAAAAPISGNFCVLVDFPLVFCVSLAVL